MENISIKLYGADWCSDCQRAKSFLKTNNVSYEFIDIEDNPEAIQLIEKINNGKRIIPTIIINGESYTNPDNSELAKVLGINGDKRIVLFGADWCPDCIKSKTFLKENGIHYQYINIDENKWAIPHIEKINNGKRKIPTIFINDDILVEPENEALRIALEIDKEKTETVYDSIIIGGGAAGLTTSIYAQREQLNTLILEKRTIGGNAFLTEKIENYPGFVSISGPELMHKMEDQAKSFGATIKTGEEVVNIDKVNDLFHVKTKSDIFLGKTVVLSTGSSYRKLNIPGEKELIGSNVHFCATCDGAFYVDKEVIVVGGGNSALEEGIYLSAFTKKVKIINNAPTFSASKTYIDKVAEIENIEVFHNKNSTAFSLDDAGKFESLIVADYDSGAKTKIKADGVFIFIGLVPNNQSFNGIIEMNENGFIKTDELAQTSVKGIFAAGDNREGSIAQVASATGEGVLASYGIKKYLKSSILN